MIRILPYENIIIFKTPMLCLNIVMYKTIFVINIIIYMYLQHSNVL